MIKFLKVKGIYTRPDGTVINNEATKLLDDYGTTCANKGFVYGVGVGIGTVGACYGTWKLGQFIGHRIVDHKNKKKENKKTNDNDINLKVNTKECEEINKKIDDLTNEEYGSKEFDERLSDCCKFFGVDEQNVKDFLDGKTDKLKI